MIKGPTAVEIQAKVEPRQKFPDIFNIAGQAVDGIHVERIVGRHGRGRDRWDR